jgi:hypothetical protein
MKKSRSWAAYVMAADKVMCRVVVHCCDYLHALHEINQLTWCYRATTSNIRVTTYLRGTCCTDIEEGEKI